MSKMFHIIYKNYLLSNTSWHAADIPGDSEIKLFGEKNVKCKANEICTCNSSGWLGLWAKQVPAAKWVKKLEGKKNHAIHLGLCKNMFLTLLQKKKKLLSALVDNKNLSVRHLLLKHTMF